MLTSPTDIQIKIFDHAITFFNPGKLYGGLTIDELRTDSYQSQTRNKLVAEAFYLTHDIEKYGSGYFRVRKEVADYPTMTFRYEEVGSGYFVELKYAEKRVESIPKSAPKTRDQLMVLIQENPRIIREEMGERLGISVDGVKRQINKLKTDDILQKVGSHRSGYWTVT